MVTATRETQVLVGRNVLLLLRHDGLHIKDLAAGLGINASLLSRRLSGETGMEIDELVQIAQALRVDNPADFFLSPGEFLNRVRPTNICWQDPLPIFDAADAA